MAQQHCSATTHINLGGDRKWEFFRHCYKKFGNWYLIEE